MRTSLVVLVCASFALALPAQAASAAAAPTAAPAAKKKEEPAPKIQGMEVSRGEKGFLGVQVVDGKFRINFYDAKKKPMNPDVARAALRWDPKYKVGQERVVLNPGGEKFLTSERFIRPPYNFKLYITLLKDASTGDDLVGETHVIDFRQ